MILREINLKAVTCGDSAAYNNKLNSWIITSNKDN